MQMEIGDTFCPTCKEHNLDTKLQLKQINFNAAVYLCPRKKCTYPKRHPWLLVQRTFDDLTKLISEKKLLKEETKVVNDNKVKVRQKKKKATRREAQLINNSSTVTMSLPSIQVETVDVKGEAIQTPSNLSEITQNIELFDVVKNDDAAGPENMSKSEDIFDSLLQELGLLDDTKSECPVPDGVKAENGNGLCESSTNASLDYDDPFSTSVSNVLNEFMSNGDMEGAGDFGALSLDDILGM